MKAKIMLKLDNWNKIIGRSRGNKYAANSHKKAEMEAISYYLKDLAKIEEYPLELVFTWHIKSVVSDLDNKSIKSILDCMQKMGIIENDNIKYINKITHIAVRDVEEYVEMEVKKSADI